MKRKGNIMTKKCILHIATSVDGFIADENGKRDWTFDAQRADTDFKAFYDNVDDVIMGRKTYDQVKADGQQMFKDKKVFVITHYLRQKEANVTFVHEDIKGLIQNLKNENGGNIWILGGSEIVNILIKENLIDELVITSVPVLLGKGVRLFKDDNPTIALDLKEVKSYQGYTQTTYAVK